MSSSAYGTHSALLLFHGQVCTCTSCASRTFLAYSSGPDGRSRILLLRLELGRHQSAKSATQQESSLDAWVMDAFRLRPSEHGPSRPNRGTKRQLGTIARCDLTVAPPHALNPNVAAFDAYVAAAPSPYCVHIAAATASSATIAPMPLMTVAPPASLAEGLYPALAPPLQVHETLEVPRLMQAPLA